MKLHIDNGYDRGVHEPPTCPFCFSPEWETNGNIQNGMVVRDCTNCKKAYTDEATGGEQRAFNSRKGETVFKKGVKRSHKKIII